MGAEPIGVGRELDSVSVHLGHEPDSPVAGVEPASFTWHSGGDGGDFEQLLHERTVLLGDLNGVKATFDLTLRSLQSILELGSGATWPSVLKRVEALAGAANGASCSGLSERSTAQDTDAAEVRQAEVRCEQLEEKLEEREANMSRLREILVKQQGLLSLTTHEIELHQEQNAKHEEAIAGLEVRESVQHATMEAQAERLHAQARSIAHLHAECAQMEDTIASEDAAQKRQEAEHELRLIECEQQHRSELADERAGTSSAKAEYERQRLEWEKGRREIRELSAELALQGEHSDQMRSQLDLLEAARRRHHIYHPKHRSMDASTSSGASTGAMSSPRSISMDKDEHNRFMAHFPMASRTERHMRNLLDDGNHSPTPRRPEANSQVHAQSRSSAGARLMNPKWSPRGSSSPCFSPSRPTASTQSLR